MTSMAPTVPSRPAGPLASALPDVPDVPDVPAVRLACRVRLAPGPATVAAARAQVEAVIRAWDLPVDAAVAVLLTSELVTNAVTHGAGKSVILSVSCDAAGLRVDVHDGSADLPVLADAPADAETGRGLLLVTSLSAEWGFYRTATGKAVYFTLEFPAGVTENAVGGPGGRGPTSVS